MTAASMLSVRLRVARAFTLTVCASASALLAPVGRTLRAQALSYPALQVPTVVEREFTAALVGGRGTMLLGQWRELISGDMHGGFDIGLYDPNAGRGNTTLFAAGHLGKQLARADREQPLDVLLTAGAGLAIADGRSSLRVPIGAALGHTFELEDGMALTPFVHPRASIDFCSSCSPRGRSESDVSLNFDVGASFNFNRRLSARVSALFSGSDYFGGDALAVALTWTPAGLRR
ncbi:MAG: hypothetical protein MUD17_00990 [Gemmatimonadaceae bacterium]|nr:hypothetical protein [Gemmatimonadaceae bacterium]